MEPVPATSRVNERACHPCTLEPRDASGRTVRNETEQDPVAMEASCACVGHPCTPEPRDASGGTVRTETEQEPVATEAGCACVCHRHLKPTRAHLTESR
ncbi:unnamed protein product [Gadus morhua 'NCC']